jgi:hypothetical protein
MIMDKRMNEIMKENLDLQEKRLSNSYPTKNGSWGSLVDGFEQRFPLFLVRTCKKQQTKAFWKCCKTHPKCQKKLCFYTEFFLHKI